MLTQKFCIRTISCAKYLGAEEGSQGCNQSSRVYLRRTFSIIIAMCTLEKSVKYEPIFPHVWIPGNLCALKGCWENEHIVCLQTTPLILKQVSTYVCYGLFANVYYLPGGHMLS